MIPLNFKCSESLIFLAKVTQSCPILCNPVDYTVHGILQVRTLEWVAFPFSRGSSQARDQTQVSRIAGDLDLIISYGHKSFCCPCILKSGWWGLPMLFVRNLLIIPLSIFEVISFLLRSDLEFSIRADKAYLLCLDSSALVHRKIISLALNWGTRIVIN